MTDILEGWGTVTKASHPYIFRAFELISEDRGSGAGHDNYSVVPEWVPFLKGIEATLGTLTNIELEDFCVGEWDKMDELAKRSSKLQLAGRMLNSFYLDWEKPA